MTTVEKWLSSGRKLRDGQRWGRWKLELPYMMLTHTGVDYGVELATCRTSAEVLDWIAQLSHKTWVTNEDLGNLVRALDDLLDLQENFCPCGSSLVCNPVRIVKGKLDGGEK